MKCDLHVHSIHSGMCTVPLLKGIRRVSYNDPLEVYSVLKNKGMDLVTLTDHDSVGGAEALRRYRHFPLQRRDHLADAQRHQRARRYLCSAAYRNSAAP
jgi:predicted metal-dependent phosphoesterase TrpH